MVCSGKNKDEMCISSLPGYFLFHWVPCLKKSYLSIWRRSCGTFYCRTIARKGKETTNTFQSPTFTFEIVLGTDRHSIFKCGHATPPAVSSKCDACINCANTSWRECSPFLTHSQHLSSPHCFWLCRSGFGSWLSGPFLTRFCSQYHH